MAPTLTSTATAAAAAAASLDLWQPTTDDDSGVGDLDAVDVDFDLLNGSGNAASADLGGPVSDFFSDTDYGLLNAAKFALNEEIKWNFSSVAGDGHVGDGPPDVVRDGVDIVTAYQSSYSQFAIIVLSVIISAMMVVILVGNILVVIAIFTENNLTGVQNWFIASLAVADMLIGLLIMPFSLSSELMGYWMFGKMWCDVHAAMDVLLCTSSIMNICLISLDRYWSITRAVDYLNARTPTKVTLMIVIVWILSGLISIPPLLGWKVEQVLCQTRPSRPTDRPTAVRTSGIELSANGETAAAAMAAGVKEEATVAKSNFSPRPSVVPFLCWLAGWLLKAPNLIRGDKLFTTRRPLSLARSLALQSSSQVKRGDERAS